MLGIYAEKKIIKINIKKEKNVDVKEIKRT